MGNIENEFKKRRVRGDIRKAILNSVAATGTLAVAILAPNAVRHLKSLGFIPNKRDNEIIKRSRNKLVSNGLLIYKGKYLQITEKGKRELGSLEHAGWKVDKPKKWDGRWRMLIFDIPEYRRKIRDKIRTTLMHIGFIKVQQSVWIYPYDCEDLVTLLKADFSIGKDLLYIIVDSIENDNRFRKIFGFD